MGTEREEASDKGGRGERRRRIVREGETEAEGGE